MGERRGEGERGSEERKGGRNEKVTGEEERSWGGGREGEKEEIEGEGEKEEMEGERER